MNPLLLNIPSLIETERLKLVMPQAGYGEKLYHALIDGYEDGVKWLNWNVIRPTIESIEIDCRKHHAEFILRTFIRYIIIDKHTNFILGRCGFPSIIWPIPQCTLSYFVRKSERSKGYATEAIAALVALAFKEMNMRKIEINCDNENKASNKIPLKLNFSLEYQQRGTWPRPDGTLTHLNTYSCFSLDELLLKRIIW